MRWDNRLAPGKRPRTTPHAMIVFKDGEFFLAYSTPGGGMQTQRWCRSS
jgi:gamma-glutamyltranspeptidase/glutathione hydrolase